MTRVDAPGKSYSGTGFLARRRTPWVSPSILAVVTFSRGGTTSSLQRGNKEAISARQAVGLVFTSYILVLAGDGVFAVRGAL
jgi:hypothetical protein